MQKLSKRTSNQLSKKKLSKLWKQLRIVSKLWTMRMHLYLILNPLWTKLRIRKQIMNLKLKKKNWLLRKRERQRLLNSLRENNLQSLTKKLMLSWRKKKSRERKKKSKRKRMMLKCIRKLWLKMMLEMELTLEVVISKLLLINKLSKTMLLMFSLVLVICLKFLTPNQKMMKLKRKK